MTDKIELKEEVLELERETSFLVKSNKKKLEKDRTGKTIQNRNQEHNKAAADKHEMLK